MIVGTGYLGGNAIADGAYVDSGSNAHNVTSTTYSGILPARASTRTIVVLVGWGCNPNRTLVSATIGGVAATIRKQRFAGVGTSAALIDAEVPVSGGNDVALTFSGALGSSGSTWISVFDVGDAMYKADDPVVDVTAMTASLAVVVGDFVVCCANGFRSPFAIGTWSWSSPLTESHEVVQNNNRYAAAYYAVTAAATLSITATNSAAEECAGMFAVYTPPA